MNDNKSSFTIHNKTEENQLDKMFGMDKYRITKSDIYALLDGKILYSCENGEYATIIELVEDETENENCIKCIFCENIQNDKKITILDDNNIFRALRCGFCCRYCIEVSEYDCCSNFEEKGGNTNE